MKKVSISLSLLFLPAITFAQGSVETFLINTVTFFNDIVMPFMFGVAFLIFVINAVRFFVIQGNNEDGREKAKSLMLYSILAFVFLIVFWGIINMLSSSVGLEGCSQPMSDYEKLNFVGPMLPPC